jgi:hypothetical protein
MTNTMKKGTTAWRKGRKAAMTTYIQEKRGRRKEGGLQICALELDQPPREQYFIGSFEPELPSGRVGSALNNSDAHQTQDHGNLSQTSIHNFLLLPQVAVPRRQRRTREEPLVDYSKSKNTHK